MKPVEIKANGTKNEWFSEDPTILIRVTDDSVYPRISSDTNTFSFIPTERKFYRFRVIEDNVERKIELDLRGDIE